MGMRTSETVPSTDPTLPQPRRDQAAGRTSRRRRPICVCIASASSFMTIGLCLVAKSAFGVTVLLGIYMLTGISSCDDWFHPYCIGLEEYQCDLLEHFYCGRCQGGEPFA